MSEQKKSQRNRTAEQQPSREEILKAFGASTSDMIQKAAVILEEEVAVGLLAAREVERSMRETGELRSESFDDILVRLRKDAHDVVNIIGEQVDQMRSSEFDELSHRFQKDAHEAVDVLLNAATHAPSLINRLMQMTNLTTTETTDSAKS
ncbi:MAG: hypothetical protein H6657_20665 [Ardenticatenaceae bacterium]|nr:hypothetical protein [Ardenticatenaceae bacterium]